MKNITKILFLLLIVGCGSDAGSKIISSSGVIDPNTGNGGNSGNNGNNGNRGNNGNNCNNGNSGNNGKLLTSFPHTRPRTTGSPLEGPSGLGTRWAS